MEILYSITILLMGLFGLFLCKLGHRSFFNCGSFFSIMWGIIGFFSNLGLYGMDFPSDFINFTIIVSLFAFILFYLLLLYLLPCRFDKTVFVCLEIRKKVICYCNFMVTFFMLPFFFKSLNIIAVSGFAQLRGMNFNGAAITGRDTLINLILENICFPIIIVSIILCSINICLNNYRYMSVFILAFVNLFIYEITQGARSGFVIAIVIFVFSFLKTKNCLKSYDVYSKLYSQKNNLILSKLLVYIVPVSIFFIVIYITTQRSLAGSSVIENFYYYFFSGPTYLSKLWKDNNNIILSNMLYGTATFGFLYDPIAYVLKYVLGYNITITSYFLNSIITNIYYAISSSILVNSISTVYFYFLADWGYFGLFIGPILLASTSIVLQNFTIKYCNIRYLAFEIYWFLVLYRTLFKWEMIGTNSSFVLFFIVLFTYSKNLSKNHSLGYLKV